MSKGVVTVAGVVLVLLIVVGGCLKLSGYLDILVAQMETAVLQAQAAYELAYAERLRAQYEGLAEAYRAQGEKELKEREGKAILYPSIAASFSVLTQSLLLVCWNILIPLVVLAFMLVKALQPLIDLYIEYKRKKYQAPTITYIKED